MAVHALRAGRISGRPDEERSFNALAADSTWAAASRQEPGTPAGSKASAAQIWELLTPVLAALHQVPYPREGLALGTEDEQMPSTVLTSFELKAGPQSS